MHANGGLITGVLHASVKNGAFLCILGAFLRLCVHFCAFFPTKMERKVVQSSAKMCKKHFYALPTLSKRFHRILWGEPKERRRRRAEKWSSKTRKWTAQFSHLILRFSGVSTANLKGTEKKTDSPKTPFGTTVPSRDAF